MTLPDLLTLNVLAAPPKFTKELEETITLKAGASHVLELPFSANPMPKVKWTFNGSAALPDKKRFTEETIRCLTTLRMSKVTRKDAGLYKVELENVHGSTTYSVRLIVLGEYRNGT